MPEERNDLIKSDIDDSSSNLPIPGCGSVNRVRPKKSEVDISRSKPKQNSKFDFNVIYKVGNPSGFFIWSDFL